MNITNKLKLTLSAVIMVAAVNEIKAQKPVYDYVIKKVTVFDGSGKDSVLADVAIAGDTIAFFGNLKHKYKAHKTVKGKGLYLSPGFIDPHTHYYTHLTHKDSTERILPRAVMQGVTTVFVGNDGDGPLPIKSAQAKVNQLKIGPNVAFLVGHNTVRRNVLGENDVQPTPAQLSEMEKVVETAMTDGAFGISTGLFYTPGNYAKTEEVITLSKVAAKYGGIYDTHQRDEGAQGVGVVKSTQEVLNIGYKAHIPVHFSHIKISGPLAWSKRDSVIYWIEKAQHDGVKVTANQYPYIASRTSLIAAVVPTWVRDGGVKAMRKRFQDSSLKDSILNGITKLIAARTGDADKLFIYAKNNPEINTKSLKKLADNWKISPEEAVMKITAKESPSVHSFSMREEDVETFMKKPWVMTGSDGGNDHPRGHATFSRYIEEYAMNRKLFSLSHAIYKSSYLTAQTFKIKKRGLIKQGYYADLILFNPKKYKANNSYDNGEVLSSGVNYLWINGKTAIEKENLVYSLSGKALSLNQP
ncbi:N-acyl-D-amino-acid deacylase family protein [Pedobacter sp.]